MQLSQQSSISTRVGSSTPGFTCSRNGTPPTASFSFAKASSTRTEAVEDDEGQGSAYGDGNYDNNNNNKGTGVLEGRKHMSEYVDCTVNPRERYQLLVHFEQ